VRFSGNQPPVPGDQTLDPEARKPYREGL
jgi:hypothetical protein